MLASKLAVETTVLASISRTEIEKVCVVRIMAKITFGAAALVYDYATMSGDNGLTRISKGKDKINARY